ncbi:acetyltransferase [Elizabethkingia argentiflava]|uniref:Acetyltransferase n=1 Tax=Elizabethkingia argenteiflava TaxID=2681556 RepID=A0A845PY25_9FLAO|nr:acetyltransferase [Elizabethkingia argenteiflava]NAW51367.1 acetyltransferase [Elizabethkingia argenteiflava]
MYLYGASGHGKVIAEIAEQNNIKIEAFIDADVNKQKILDYKILHKMPVGKDDPIIISIGNNIIRKKVVSDNPDLNYTCLIHPKTAISTRAVIAEGSVIMAGVVVNAEVQVGRHCILNTNTSLDHDCVLGDFVHISPNAALAGNVEIGEGTHIGIGASVIQGIKIGRWCTIGAGSVVIKDVPDGATLVGNPGKIIKMKNIHNL